MGHEKSKLPIYEVEFIPVERRLDERRTSSSKPRQRMGIEKRRKSGRRSSEAKHKPIK
jgi:hypothetical protein